MFVVLRLFRFGVWIFGRSGEFLREEGWTVDSFFVLLWGILSFSIGFVFSVGSFFVICFFRVF